ncbi:MAG: acetyltransferase [Caudoviricetes sp.]|nr:MAG: acetyltransferase [Caudoviricetes sp.]
MDIFKFWKQVENLGKNYPDISFYLEDNGDDNEVYIASIMRLNPTKTRKGIGREFLKKFCFICDCYGVNVELQIEEYSAKSKLKFLYESVGFYVIDEEEDEYIRMRRESK